MISYHTKKRAQRYNSAARSSGRQHHLCARGASSLCCGELLVSEPVICHPTIPHVSAALPLCVSIDAETYMVGTL